MFKYLFWAIGLYILIRFIFNFVIPVYRATRQMKGQMRDFQSRMQQGQEGFEQNANAQKSEKSRSKREDYIDFEEIK
jgi:hypothetical protein